MAGDTRPRGVDFLIFGKFKLGKSTLAATAPGPVLVLDFERGSRFTAHRHTVWDIRKDPSPPAADGTWDVCSVYVARAQDVDVILQWLNSGKHPFATVIIDSVSNWQMNHIDEKYGDKQLERKEWGEIFRYFRSRIMKFQQLKDHAVRPLDALILISMAKRPEGEKMGPMIQGQLKDVLPYMVNVVAALDLIRIQGKDVRRLFIAPNPTYDTGSHADEALGAYIDEPNVTDMIARINKYLDGHAGVPTTA